MTKERFGNLTVLNSYFKRGGHWPPHFKNCSAGPGLPFKQFLLEHSPSVSYCDPYHTFSTICEPEEDWYGEPKYCYVKTIHVVLISFAKVFGLLLFGY